jgi:sulfite exporter TauE/SafE
MGGESIGLGAALLLGLGFGAGPCNIACLPFLGPVLLAGGNGVRNGWRVLLPFSLGRLSGYTLLGLAAGLGGRLLGEQLEGPAVRWMLGGATLLAALGMWLRLRKPGPACSGKASGGIRVAQPGHGLLPGGLFFMGAGMALNPCAPLATVTLAAAATASAGGGLSLGLAFGLGAVVIPALVFGLGIAHLGAEIKTQLTRWRGAVETTGVAMLALMGVSTAMGWMTP